MKRFLLWLAAAGLLSAAAAQNTPDNPALARWRARAAERRLAESPEWRRLLHQRRGLLGGWRSDIDGPDFFLSPHGRTDAAAELDATLAGFAQTTADPNESARCLYPARFAWLDARLGLSDDVPPAACPRYAAWREKLNAQSVSLIFSSYYMNNPSSLYGHTFLRLSRGGKYTGQPLLDYTVNFAAVTNTSSGLAFAVKGLGGGYPGRFSTEPYYLRVQKYNNIESRDLWEYQLTLSTGDVDRLLAHLWELGPTSMSYYFFNRNCSFQLLPLLEVARPSLDLSDRFRFRAIPLDTLRAVLGAPGLVSGRTYRPSQRQRLLSARAALSDSERTLAASLVENSGPDSDAAVTALPVDRRAAVLNAALEFLRYRAGFKRPQPPWAAAAERRILLLQNAISTPEPTPVVREPAPPEAAHPAGRVSWAVGADRRSGFEEISVRPALHDLENDPTGFVPGSQLEMMAGRIRYDNGRGKAYLENFTFIDVLSLAPRDPWIRQPSWGLRVALDTAHDLSRPPEDALTGDVRGGSGLTFAIPGWPGALLYGLLQGEGAVGSAFHDDARLGAGGTAGVLFPFGGRVRVSASASAFRFGVGDVSDVVRFESESSVSLGRRWEARLRLDRANRHREAVASLLRYF